ncbi:patatin-like phospholipase family protein [Mycobacterium sp. CVI_P3]|uniref:Patatin-like phospholipase family protein n=1 Tax=Mycobacterium pinniadriaticum TaxID=2994102 RepID=A0ABT3S8N7_9MYCO|nr:patatin-like phospholipase family protein [Mycobacterium pinniadriaticum]MCX2929437.1 patatin-like phospholipase family protein [Mycobacterium pinniadriaticum]MCX2935861.1 patatin-like phospholipase family protein [Mycobacterium pinniadriaticum]
MPTPVTKPIDLVLAGGGVKGIGLAGAVVKLMEAGYRAYRVAGSSAGSIVGSIVAAAAKNDQLTPQEVRDLTLGIDYRKFLDPGPLERVPLLGPSWAILQGTGIYQGDYAHRFIADQLLDLGVSTFGDLRLDDDQLPEEQRYRLVVTAADVTTGQLVRLPWDYRRLYGLDPDEQPVADAVRASMSIPFFFRPVTLTSATGRESTLVDGGLLSNYPIDSLDRPDGKQPRWPTFGVTLLPDLPENDDKVIPALAPLRLFGGPSLLEDVIITILVGRDQAYLNLPWVSARTIRVDSTSVGVLDFDITHRQIDALYAAGYDAATTFLSTWDERAYVERFR